jgi:outer membrane lipoprotein-sorting protein
MMKKILFVFTLLLGTQFIHAQNDPKAKKILDGVSTKVKAMTALTGNFTIKSFTSKGKPNGTKSGTISLKGNKYTLKQGNIEIICDGFKTYSFDGAKTITVAPAEDGNKTLTPQKILSGIYDKDFTYKLVSSSGNFNEIELRPTDSRKNFQKVNIFIDKVKGLITKAKLLDKSNNQMEFDFTNINSKAVLADANFSFNKSKYPKDVEILD